MCYSAQVWSDFRRYQRAYGAHVDYQSFAELLRRRQQGERLLLTKGMTDAFKWPTPDGAEEEECRDLVLAYEAMLVPQLHEKIEAQRQRLTKAEARLAVKQSKSASEDLRIATNNISDLQRKLADIERREPLARDDRIFTNYYCPVLTLDEDGDQVVRPMRFLCRPEGKPAFFDTKFPGTYNARRDSLGGFWKGLFGQTHAVVVMEAFFEHVKRHRLERRELAPGEAEQDVVLRFSPDSGSPLPLACLWSHWTGQGADLLSFAFITDEPPAEVAAAGHDRCPIALKEENRLAWLSAPGATLTAYDGLLEDKDSSHFGHQEMD